MCNTYECIKYIQMHFVFCCFLSMFQSASRPVDKLVASRAYGYWWSSRWCSWLRIADVQWGLMSLMLPGWFVVGYNLKVATKLAPPQFVKDGLSFFVVNITHQEWLSIRAYHPATGYNNNKMGTTGIVGHPQILVVSVDEMRFWIHYHLEHSRIGYPLGNGPGSKNMLCFIETRLVNDAFSAQPGLLSRAYHWSLMKRMKAFNPLPSISTNRRAGATRHRRCFSVSDRCAMLVNTTLG